jgi:hypothetical protein
MSQFLEACLIRGFSLSRKSSIMNSPVLLRSLSIFLSLNYMVDYFQKRENLLMAFSYSLKLLTVKELTTTSLK